MAGEKKVFVLKPVYKIYDAGGDLSKNWFVYWRIDGKRFRKYGKINSHTTVSARKKAAEKLRKQLRNKSKRITNRVEEAVMDYLAIHENQWKRSTFIHYRSSARVFFEFLGGRKFSPKLLDEFLKHIKRNKHATTYNRYLAFLKKILSPLGYEYCFEDYKRLKAVQTPARYFQKHQVRKLLDRIDEKDPELGLFVRFIYYCFIRPTELRKMRVSDILMEERQIRVPGEVSKNRKTEFIVIPNSFFDNLSFIYDRAPGAYLFPATRDPSKPISKNRMYERHKVFLEELGFGKGYALYSWKHTGAVAAAKAGISLKEIQMQLRHHSLDETDKYLRQMGVKDMAMLQSNFPSL